MEILEIRIYRKLDSVMTSLESLLPGISSQWFIAGGSIASLIMEQFPKDYDLFAGSKPDIPGILKQLRKGKIDYTETDRAITFKLGKITIQLVTKFYGNDITDSFDFEHTRVTYRIVDGRQDLNIPKSTLFSIASRNLVYRSSDYPVCSLFRAVKFCKRGWQLRPETLLSIMFDIYKLNLKDHRVLYEQLAGIDVAYLQRFTSELESSNEPVSQLIKRIYEYV